MSSAVIEPRVVGGQSFVVRSPYWLCCRRTTISNDPTDSSKVAGKLALMGAVCKCDYVKPVFEEILKIPCVSRVTIDMQACGTTRIAQVKRTVFVIELDRVLPDHTSLDSVRVAVEEVLLNHEPPWPQRQRR